MITNLFHMTVPEDAIDHFNEVGRYNLQTSHENEPGTRLMLVMHETATPTNYWILEMYDSEEAYQTHRTSPQFQYFVQNGATLVTSREKIEVTPLLLQHTFTPGELHDLTLSLIRTTSPASHQDRDTYFLLEETATPEQWIVISDTPVSDEALGLTLDSGFYH